MSIHVFGDSSDIKSGEVVTHTNSTAIIKDGDDYYILDRLSHGQSQRSLVTNNDIIIGTQDQIIRCLRALDNDVVVMSKETFKKLLTKTPENHIEQLINNIKNGV